jgi:hypothetical protein
MRPELGVRPAAPRESASPPFDKLVFGSFLMFPSPGFRAAKPAIWAAASNRWRLFARIDILALPFASANGIGACLANGPAHLFHISSPNYTPVAPEPESRLMARKLAALFFFKPLTRKWL